jgi:GT2 family glycosyltransferase
VTLRARRPLAGDADVAVAIPVLNGGDRLLQALAAAAEQEGVGTVQLLVADSGSDDGAVERAMQRWPSLAVFDVIGRFDHGRTRTELVLAARAPIVALLSQDAVPQGPRYLAELLASFADDAVLGAYARQVPRPGADPLVVDALSRWTPPGDAPLLRRAPPAGWGSLTPWERLERSRFDNVGSTVRRSAIEALPFPSRSFGEDLAWGRAALDAGGALAYVPTAVVEHHHDPTVAEAFARNRVAHRQAAAEFGLLAVPSLPAGARALVGGVLDDARRVGPTWALRGLPRRLGALAGQYVGARERP